MIDILLPLYLLPDYSIVTMPTGEKEYTVRREIKIYQHNDDPLVLRASNGTVMLMSDNSINNHPEDKSVKIRFESVQEAAEYLEEMEHKLY